MRIVIIELFILQFSFYPPIVITGSEKK